MITETAPKLYHIKGICENCGYHYEGKANLEKPIKCPKCKEETNNNDEADAVNDLNIAEGYKGIYNQVASFENME